MADRAGDAPVRLTVAQAVELRAVANDRTGYMETDVWDYRIRVELETLG